MEAAAIFPERIASRPFAAVLSVATGEHAGTFVILVFGPRR